jgi:hypothetical protein
MRWTLARGPRNLPEQGHENAAAYISDIRSAFAIHLKHAPKVAADRAHRKQNEHKERSGLAIRRKRAGAWRGSMVMGK